MTRHIPDQSVLWCDNLKLNGSQSHLEIGEVLLPYFYFLQCHTLKLYSVVITVPVSKTKIL